MSDEEMRVRIAQALGWTVVRVRPISDDPDFLARWDHLELVTQVFLQKQNNWDNWTVEELGWSAADRLPARAWQVLPAWATDLGAAFQLVRHMPYFKLVYERGEWECQSRHCGAYGDHTIERKRRGDDQPYYRCGCLAARSPDVTRAICLAFIALLEFKQPAGEGEKP